jgi:hypothetical protein
MTLKDCPYKAARLNFRPLIEFHKSGRYVDGHAGDATFQGTPRYAPACISHTRSYHKQLQRTEVSSTLKCYVPCRVWEEQHLPNSVKASLPPSA